MTIVDVVFEVHDHLERQEVAHAFGGALALSYYAEPRATIDVDLNIFSPFATASAVVFAFEAMGLVAVEPEERWLPVAGVRLSRDADRATVDLFFSLDEHYDEIAARAVTFPFGPEHRPLPFLSAEDLALFKLSFGRPKDWVDLQSLCRAGRQLDVAYIERQLVALRGPAMNPRLARLRAMLRQVGEAR